MFFLPAAGWDYMSTYGRFFFFFVLKKDKQFKKEVLLLGLKRFLSSEVLQQHC
jgi:hypothetical protein